MNFYQHATMAAIQALVFLILIGIDPVEGQITIPGIPEFQPVTFDYSILNSLDGNIVGLVAEGQVFGTLQSFYAEFDIPEFDFTIDSVSLTSASESFGLTGPVSFSNVVGGANLTASPNNFITASNLQFGATNGIYTLDFDYIGMDSLTEEGLGTASGNTYIYNVVTEPPPSTPEPNSLALLALGLVFSFANRRFLSDYLAK